MSAVSIWWGAAVVWLLLLWTIQRRPSCRGWRGTLASALFAGVILMVPWFGHPLPYWSRGLSANFSVTMAVLLVVAIFDRAFGTTIFRKRDWNAAWTFGAASSLLLYPSALGLGPQNFDSYALGWPWLFWRQSFVLFGGAAFVASALVLRCNRFGLVLLAAFAGYAMSFQESANFWDYLIDPVFAAVSLLWSLWRIVGLANKRRSA